MNEKPETLIARLRVLGALKTGDPMPEWLGGPNGWGEPLAQLCAEAADEIEFLRSVAGVVSKSPGLAELKRSPPTYISSADGCDGVLTWPSAAATAIRKCDP